MKVVVMRHGEAQGFDAVSGDRNRNLTLNGEKQADCSGKLLALYPGLEVVKVLASDYARAVQTGQIVAKENKVSCQLVPTLSISHENLEQVEQMVADLSVGLKSNQALVLVSHIPIVYNLCQIFAKNVNFAFHTASFVVIDYVTKQVMTDSLELATQLG